MDAATLGYFARRPYVVQRLLWEIDIRGKCVEVHARKPYQIKEVKHRRQRVSTFSRAARLRLLKFIAGVDWGRIRQGVFVTLTYPDSVVITTVDDRNKHRYLFQRFLEGHFGKQISLLWRIEWVPRQSGQYKEWFLPHFHLIVFAVPYIPYDRVLDWWQRSIGTKEWCDVWIERLDDEKKAGLYVSKYAAKVPSLSLDNASYLNSVAGRHYGFTRKPGIPLCPRTHFTNLTAELVCRLREMACTSLPYYDPQFDGGFSLLGERASRWSAAIWSLALDEGAVVAYDD